jgi:hypothetical protein
MTERRLDVLVVRWYEYAAGAPEVVPRWLAAAREHLPEEAVPRRFGDTEPLRGRLDRDGEQALRDAYARADSLLFLGGDPPVYHASLATAGRSRGPVRVHSLQAELDPADERVQRFALALTHPGTVYVSASVAGGMLLAGRTLFAPAERPEEPYLAPMGDWLGLPPAPPNWCWFGPGYARLVRRQVPAEPVAGGLWYAGGGPWVPEPLHARLAETDPARRHAPRLPRGSRRSPLRLW